MHVMGFGQNRSNERVNSYFRRVIVSAMSARSARVKQPCGYRKRRGCTKCEEYATAVNAVGKEAARGRGNVAAYYIFLSWGLK